MVCGLSNDVLAQATLSLKSKVRARRVLRTPLGRQGDLIGDRSAQWTLRRRVTALLRKAFCIVFMGRQRALGQLGGGKSAVAALLMSMGVIAMPQAALAQYAAGTGASAATGPGNTAVGQTTTAKNTVTGATVATGSTALGTNASATGGNAIAVGVGATAPSSARQPVPSLSAMLPRQRLWQPSLSATTRRRLLIPVRVLRPAPAALLLAIALKRGVIVLTASILLRRLRLV